MTVGEDSEGKEAAVDKFPAGMRVLAVDDDPVCLKLLESLLRHCKYHGERSWPPRSISPIPELH